MTCPGRNPPPLTHWDRLQPPPWSLQEKLRNISAILPVINEPFGGLKRVLKTQNLSVIAMAVGGFDPNVPPSVTGELRNLLGNKAAI